jgi:hypothetical protein
MLVFLVEEPSMKAFLVEYLPRLFAANGISCTYHVLAFEGKKDLENNIPRKLKAFHNAVFIISRDNDGADCIALKTRLVSAIPETHQHKAWVRIICQELEAWYFGVSEVAGNVLEWPGMSGIIRKASFRNPDEIVSPSKELEKRAPRFRKIESARLIGLAMPVEIEKNKSTSFKVFFSKTIELATSITSN